MIHRIPCSISWSESANRDRYAFRVGGVVVPRVRGLTNEWALKHRSDLLEDWNLARTKAELKEIAPLE